MLLQRIQNSTIFIGRRLLAASADPAAVLLRLSSSFSMPGVNPMSAHSPSLVGPIEPPMLEPGTTPPPPGVVLVDVIEVATSTKVDDGFPVAPNPEMCCGSGCPNCVWIQFAEEVMAYVKSISRDGEDATQKKMVRDALERSVEDDNLRAYLLVEIQAKGF